jgi:nucleoid-associated protein YgaU
MRRTVAAAGSPAPPPTGERLDLVAARYYGDPALWRVLAAYNGITDPVRIPPPRSIRVPPLATLRRW